MKQSFWETSFNLSTYSEVQIVGDMETVSNSVVVKPEHLSYLWRTIDDALDSIYEDKNFKHTKTTIYHACETLCLLRYEEDLFQRLKSSMIHWLHRNIRKLRKCALTWRGSVLAKRLSFLRQLDTWNTRLNKALALVDVLFIVLTRRYLITLNLKSFRIVAVNYMKKYLVQDPILFCLRTTLLHLLSMLRDQRNLQDLPLLAQTLVFTQEAGIYHTHLETPIMENFMLYYTNCILRRLPNEAEIDLSDYLGFVLSIADHEERTFYASLPDSTRKSLTDGRLRIMLTEPIISLLCGYSSKENSGKIHRERGLYKLLVTMRETPLMQLYKLCSSAGTLDPFYSYWKQCIEEEGARVLWSPLMCDVLCCHEQPVKMNNDLEGSQTVRSETVICCLIQLKKTISSMISSIFPHDSQLIRTTQSAWTNFLNQTEETEMASARLLSHERLVNCPETYSNDLIRHVLKEILEILKYLHAKDFYHELYCQDFEKRVLLNFGASFDLENYMISLLCEEYGEGFIKKNKALLEESAVSEKLVTAFHQDYLVQPSAVIKHVQFHCFVLPCSLMSATVQDENKQSYPKGYPTDSAPPLLQLRLSFEEYYKKVHKGRILRWSSVYATCILVAEWSPSQTFTMLLSQTQAVCLILFNNVDHIDVKDIVTITGISEAEILFHLKALCSSTSVPLLHADENSTGFTLNHDFVSSSTYLTFIEFLYKEQECIERAVSSSQEDHSYHIDAFVVRTMKSAKTMEYQSLISQILHHFKGGVSTTLIEKRLKSLVDREFIYKNPDRPRLYHYMLNP